MQTTPDAPATAGIARAEITAIRRRLDRWELDHLRKLAAELVERLESAQIRISDLESEAALAYSMADSWREDADNLVAELQAIGTTVGMSQDGSLGVVAGEGGAA